MSQIYSGGASPTEINDYFSYFPSQWDFASSVFQQHAANYNYQNNGNMQSSQPFIDRITFQNQQRPAEGSCSSTSSMSPNSWPMGRTESDGDTIIRTFTKSAEDKKERRRVQNRASQRAYRDRKEQLIASLQVQLAQLSEKYQTVSRSHSDQTEEISQLKAELKQLESKLSSMQNMSTFWSPSSPSLTEHDAASPFDQASGPR